MMASQREPASNPLHRSGPYVLVEKIDPKRAEALLAKRARNRHLRESHVNAIARDIAAGKWIPNPHPIVLTPAGELIDGQHRLAAVIKAKKAVTLFVAYNVDEAAMDVIDRGATRTAGDVLHLHYEVGSGRAIAAICSALYSLVEGGEGSTLRKRTQITTAEVVDIYQRFEPDIAWAFAAIPTKMEPGIPSGGAAVRAAFAFMRPISPERVERLAAKYVAGEGDGVVRAMRAAAIEKRNKAGDERWSLFLKSLRGIEAYLTGERVVHLKVDGGVPDRVRKLRALATSAEKKAS